jgi:aerobic-type carbon monoxide dehydrogenase small subunit (CoxS/CutS family)
VGISPFRSPSEPKRLVDVVLLGRPRRLSANRSLLASLLLEDIPAPEFFCAIGQCFRCEYAVSGRRVRACMYYPQGGETVEALSGQEAT